MTQPCYSGRMTRTYAAHKLLEHGALTQPELLEITGWTPSEVSQTTQRLMRADVVTLVNRHGRRYYALDTSNTAHGWPHGTRTKQSEHLTGTTNSTRDNQSAGFNG